MVDVAYKEAMCQFKRPPFASFPLSEDWSLNSLLIWAQGSWNTEEQKLPVQWEQDLNQENYNCCHATPQCWICFQAIKKLYVLKVSHFLSSTPDILQIRVVFIQFKWRFSKLLLLRNFTRHTFLCDGQ